jgi:hypothetical protein
LKGKSLVIKKKGFANKKRNLKKFLRGRGLAEKR